EGLVVRPFLPDIAADRDALIEQVRRRNALAQFVTRGQEGRTSRNTLDVRIGQDVLCTSDLEEKPVVLSIPTPGFVETVEADIIVVNELAIVGEELRSPADPERQALERHEVNIRFRD